MVQYRDLNAPPSRMLADVVADMKAQERQSKTGDAGVKDLGEAGDVVWPRPDGTAVSVRDVDLDLADARQRIEDAEGALTQTGERLDAAEETVAGVAGDLARVETVVIPGAVADLEAADQAAQEQFAELGTRLDTFGDDPALESMRQALSDAQATATSASQAAAAADQAASAASQAALEAAGIAASKGRTIIQATEPQGEDRNAANIWIKPAVDDPDTDITETATTYVYLEDSDEWVPTTSDELAQAAQNALDAREAAQQAQQRAETAVANAATAQGAAEAAQRTADQATLDAAGAHNEAVAASEAANAALDRATTPTANMIDNGNGSRGMENFELRSPWIRYPEDAPTGAHASYAIEVPGGAFLDRSVAVDPSRQYVMKAAVRQANPDYEPLSDRFYMALQPLDGDGLSIATTMYARFADTLTTLAADLKPGDTTATLSSSEAWDGATTYKTLAIYDYTDASGKHWGTDYTRITARFVALSEGVVTLAAPWSGGTVGAGTPVAQALHGGAYLYPLVPSAIPHEWTDYTSQIVGGIHDPNGAVAVYRFPVPTASVRPGFLFNHTGQTESRHRVANIGLFDVTEAVAAQAAADAAQKRADEAYAEAASKLDESQVDDKIAASANGKNSITRSTSAASGDGVVEGDLWVQVDAAGDGFAQWYWDGTAWEPSLIKSDMMESLDVHKLQVTGTAKIADAVIDKLFAETFAAHKITGSELSIASVKSDGALADGSVSAVTIKDGAITTPKLTVTEDMSAAIVNAMSVNSKKLVVTDEAILNHATLIGQTVVDDINVQGKLIGTDGVFTGTVDFANVNVTGELLANEISGEYLYGTVIEGGEIRTGSDESRGSFTLGDRAYVAANDGYEAPGIRFTPANSTMIHPPGVGIDGSRAVVSGGKNASGVSADLKVGTSGVFAEVTTPVGATERSDNLRVSSAGAVMQSRKRDDSQSATISATASYESAGVYIPAVAQLQVSTEYAYSTIAARESGEVIMQTGARSLSVDSAGVWAKSGNDTVSLIPQVRQFQYSALWNMDLSPSPILVQHLPGGKLCQAQARIQNLTGSSLALPHDTWVTLNLNPIPPDLRGGYTDYIDITHAQNSARGRLEMNYSTGAIRVKSLERDKDGNPVTINWTNSNSIWFPMRWFSPN